MSTRNQIVRWLFWPTAALIVLGATALLWRFAGPRRNNTPVIAAAKNGAEPKQTVGDDDDPPAAPDPVSVKVLHPRSGAMDRVTSQVGTVQAGETVKLDAKVSGYLKKQTVDIGDRVKAGTILAIIDVPELEKQVNRNAASVELANARVAQMKAKVTIAKAEVEAAKAQVTQAEANASSKVAWVGYWSKNYLRMKKLLELTSIQEQVVDESKERLEAAKEGEIAARAAIVTTKAQVLSADARILLADADVGEALAQVKVAQAELEKSQVQLAYATIYAPFDGIITNRTMFPGEFVRSAGESSGQLPLLTIQRTDRMRIIVQIPDREVPYADPGDAAIIEIDAFKGERFEGKISRIAASENESTRLMPVEIDLENPKNRIRQGMFGHVTIYLEKAIKSLSVPTSCLVGEARDGKGILYVVRDGKAQRTSVKVGINDGSRVEILTGVTANDDVVLQPPSVLQEGSEVQATLTDEFEQKAASEMP